MLVNFPKLFQTNYVLISNMNICIFGDSLTWGAFLPFRGAWANLLRNYLESKNDQISVYDLGIDADTSAEVLARFDTEAAARNPELIIFSIGINDSAYRKISSNNITSLNEFRKNIKELINKANKITSNIIFVGLIKGDDSKTKPLPRSSTGKSYTKVSVKKYNDTLKKVCKKSNTLFIEIFNKLKNEDFDDGIHPNLGGHQKIFEEVRRVLIKII